MNFINSIAKNSNFAFFLRSFDEFFSGFRAKFQKLVTCVAFSIKFAKTNQKFAENSEFCENCSLLFKIIHWCPWSPMVVDVEVQIAPAGPEAEAALVALLAGSLPALAPDLARALLRGPGARALLATKLKGSIGEGSNHSNFSFFSFF